MSVFTCCFHPGSLYCVLYSLHLSPLSRRSSLRSLSSFLSSHLLFTSFHVVSFLSSSSVFTFSFLDSCFYLTYVTCYKKAHLPVHYCSVLWPSFHVCVHLVTQYCLLVVASVSSSPLLSFASSSFLAPFFHFYLVTYAPLSPSRGLFLSKSTLARCSKSSYSSVLTCTSGLRCSL